MILFEYSCTSKSQGANKFVERWIWKLFQPISQKTITCSKLTIKTPERRSSGSIVNFEQVNVGWVDVNFFNVWKQLTYSGNQSFNFHMIGTTTHS